MNIRNKLLTALFFASAPAISLAEPVTSFTIQDVGSGGQGAYSSTPDDLSGGFSFGPLYDNPAIAIKFDSCSTLDYPSVRASGFVCPSYLSVDTSQANTAGTFSGGFSFAGAPFLPRTGGPIVADISIVGGVPQLSINSSLSAMPWGGLFNSTVDFRLHPMTAPYATPVGNECNTKPFRPLTVYWLNRIGTTDRYNFSILWTHCISSVEGDATPVSTSYDGFNATWYLEGIMTAPDTTPPTVISTNPSNGSTTIPTNTSVSVTFSETMDPSTITTSTFTVAPNAGGPSECATISTTNNVTFTCTPTGGVFTASTLFDISLSPSITDAVADTAVNLASGVTRQFTTGSGTDVIAPLLTSITPLAAAIDVAVDTAINVTFNEPMSASTLDAITLTQGLNSVAGTVTTTDNITFTFTPDSSLSNFTTYTINVAAGDGISGANDASGNAWLTGATQAFTTIAATSLTDATSGVTVAIDNTSGASFTNFRILTAAQVGGTAPERTTLDDYFVDYTIAGVTGGQIAVSITFPESLTGKSVYKFINGAYTKLEEGTSQGQYQVVNDTTISFTILDNGPQDSDSTTGTIHDPIGTGVDLGAKPTPASLDGCFGSIVDTNVGITDRAEWLVVAGFIVWLGLLTVRRRA